MANAIETIQILYSPISLTLFIFVYAILYKYTKFGDMGTGGWRFIMAGAMLTLLLTVLGNIDFSVVGLSNSIIYFRLVYRSIFSAPHNQHPRLYRRAVLIF